MQALWFWQNADKVSDKFESELSFQALELTIGSILTRTV